MSDKSDNLYALTPELEAAHKELAALLGHQPEADTWHEARALWIQWFRDRSMWVLEHGPATLALFARVEELERERDAKRKPCRGCAERKRRRAEADIPAE